MKRVLEVFFWASLMVLIVSGCSSNDSAMDRTSSNQSEPSSGAEEAADGRGEIAQREAEMAVSDYDAAIDSDDAQEQNSFERKIIQEKYLEQEVQDLPAVIANIEASVQRISGAFIEHLEEWENETRNRTEHRALLTLRIPNSHFNTFLSKIENQGNIIRQSISGQDVTEEYVDNDSRLRNYKAHEERILDLYEKAETIEEMLQIEQELSRIRANIERLEGRQTYLDQVTSTVKLTLELFQVEEEEYLSGLEGTSLTEEAWLGFKRSIKAIISFSERGFVVLITLFPYLLVLTIIVGIILLIIKKRNKKVPPASNE